MLAAGFIVLAAALVAGLAPIALALFALAAGVIAGATVITGAGVEAGVVLAAGLLAVLLAGASPHAMPSALNPRTVESTITFVILFITPIYLKEYKPASGHRLIRHNRFALNSFFFKANVNIGTASQLVNLKLNKKGPFFDLFFAYFSCIYRVFHGCPCLLEQK